MKRITMILAAGLALFLTGCATDMSKYYEVQGKAIEADNNAVMGLAAAAATGNQGAIMALALRRSAAGQIAVPQDKALQWASILIPAATNVYGINRNAAISMANIQAESEQYTTTMTTIGGIASQGMTEAGKVVFPPVYVVPAGTTSATTATESTATTDSTAQ